MILLVALILSMPLLASEPKKEQRYKVVGRAGIELVKAKTGKLLDGWEIILLPGQRNYLAVTLLDEKRVFVFVRRGQDPEDVAFVLAHEVGHILSLRKMKRELMQKWINMRGLRLSVENWFSCTLCSDYGSPEGDFAESTSVTLFPHPRNRFMSKLGPPPNEEQRKFILDLLAAP